MTAPTVWLASYPKSGSTWLRGVCTAFLRDGPVDVNALVGVPIGASRQHFDVELGIPSSLLTALEIEQLRPRVDELLAEQAVQPYLRKVHDGYFDGPAGEAIVSAGATRGAVYVIRDPRDVAASYAAATGRSPAWARRWLADPAAALEQGADRLHEQLRQRLGTWSQHVLSWTDVPPFPVEVVRYEDLAATPVATFGRVLRFIGFAHIDDARLQSAVERASFVRLRQVEEENGFVERAAGGERFFRRGEPGSWREELPVRIAEGIRQDHQDVMARFGYR